MSELIEFKTIHLNSKDYLIEKQLREDILRKPLGRILSSQDLCYDHLFHHRGAFIQGHLMGCLMWRKLDASMGQIKQVCVHPSYQGKRMGTKLMKVVHQEMVKEGFCEVVLHARINAWSFYQQLGYEFISDEFEEVGVIHRVMRKYL